MARDQADAAEMADAGKMTDTAEEAEQARERMDECDADHAEDADAPQGSGSGSINDISVCMAHYRPMVSKRAQPRMDLQTGKETWLQVDYVNAHGLCSTKLATALGHLRHNMILFVSETWHIHDAKMRTFPGVVAISPELYRSPVSRGKGGLALFAHESVASRLHVASTGEHHLSATIDGLSISGIYLPPSMDCIAIKATLDALPESTDMILGDLNVRLGRHTRTAERDRCDTISGWCSRKGLGLRQPETEIRSSMIDHVLAKASIHSKEYHVIKAPFETDHPLLTIQVRSNGPNTANHTARFNIHKLKSAETAKKLCNAVEAMAITVRDKLVGTSQSHEARDARKTIESLDDDLTCLVQKALTDVRWAHASLPACIRAVDPQSQSRLTRPQPSWPYAQHSAKVKPSANSSH